MSEQEQTGNRAYFAAGVSEGALCQPGATAVHLNNGETWTVAEMLPGGGYLIIRSPRGTECKVRRDYWLGEAWADLTPVPPSPEQGEPRQRLIDAAKNLGFTGRGATFESSEGNLSSLTSDEATRLARGLDEAIEHAGEPDYRVMWEEAARHALAWGARFERLSDAVDEFLLVTPGRAGYAAARRKLLRVWLSVDDLDVGER